MFVRPKLLSLITTRRCTAACDHCCFGCSPAASEAIPVSRMRTLIDEAAAIQSMEAVGFTGGECFLLRHELDALVAHANRHGLRTRAVTNGYWAVHPAAARSRVAELRGAGLDELHLSTGTFHQRYVPLERVLHAARAAAEAGLFTSVVVEEFDGSSDETAVREALADLIDSDRLLLLRQPWMANADGKGETLLTHAPERSRFRPENRTACSSILNVLSVTPAQMLIACCGYTMEAIPDLHLGSVAERSIADVLHQAPNDLLKYWIHVEGPEAVLAFVQRFSAEYRLPVESPDMCQTCLHLHRDDRARRIIIEHLDAVPVQRIVAAFNARMVVDQMRQPPRHRSAGEPAVSLATAG